MISYPLIIAAGFAAGFINAIAGAGTLLSFPSLLLGGLAPVTANATSTVALWPGSATSAWAYRDRLRGQRPIARLLIVPSLLGGLLGAIILLQTPEKLFRECVPFLILLACGLLLLNEPIGRWLRKRSTEHPRQHLAALVISQFGIALYGGYFGAGIGILMLAGLASFFPEDLQSANALKNFLATVINGMAMLYFVGNGAAILPVALAMMGAAIAGGYLGARVAQRISSRWLRWGVAGYGLVVAGVLYWKS